MIFRKKPSISSDLADWIHDSFAWSEDQFGTDWASSRPLITASRAYFSAGSGQDHSTARAVADDIARLLGHETPFELVRLDDIPEEYQHNYQDMSSVAGTYIHDETNPIITYNPARMADPISFISILAHEIMHARLQPFIDDMPGAEPAHELSTDLHCITHGFGVFALEGPARLGWAGYMTQESRAYALALFMQQHSMGLDQASQFLSARSVKAVKRAMREVVQASDH